MNKKVRKFLASLSILGFFDALYLSLPYISSSTTYCIVGDQNSCDLVLNSSYAEFFFDIPNVFLGILFYLTLILIFIFWDKIVLKVKKILKISILITTLGSLFYIYLIYLQIFTLNAYCPYCLFSAFLTFTIWIKLILVYNNK